MRVAHVVYCIEFRNGKVYVGKTCNLAVRIRQHVRCAARGFTYPLHNAIRKHGMGIVTLLGNNLTNEQASELEKLSIALARSTDDRFGYNITRGGEGVLGKVYTAEQRAKISAATMGRIPWNKGLKGAQAGSMKGRKHAQDSINKISVAMSGKKPKITSERNAKIAAAKLKPILRSDGVMFPSLAAAAAAIGRSMASVSQVAGRAGRKCAGYGFRYVSSDQD